MVTTFDQRWKLFERFAHWRRSLDHQLLVFLRENLKTQPAWPQDALSILIIEHEWWVHWQDTHGYYMTCQSWSTFANGRGLEADIRYELIGPHWWLFSVCYISTGKHKHHQMYQRTRKGYAVTWLFRLDYRDMIMGCMLAKLSDMVW
jgi:hypothetical protein